MGLVVKPTSEGLMSEIRQPSVQYVVGHVLKCVNVQRHLMYIHTDTYT